MGGDDLYNVKRCPRCGEYRGDMAMTPEGPMWRCRTCGYNETTDEHTDEQQKPCPVCKGSGKV